MPTSGKGTHLGGSLAHQKLVLSNLVTQLIEHCAITTTKAKAKALHPCVEKFTTKVRHGDQYVRRTVMKKILGRDIVAALFEEFVPAMDSERVGGYIRLIRVGNRKGDNAPLMRIELVMEKVKKKAVAKAAEKTAAKAAADEAEKTVETAAKCAEETREEGDLAKVNEAEEVAAEAGRAADAAEQVVNER